MFMRACLTIAALLAACWLVGCGDGLPRPPLSAKDQPRLGPHQGTALALPDDLGYVELVNEPEVGERGEAVTTSLVAYFLDRNARDPANSLPTDVNFVAELAPGRSRTITLKGDPRPSEPAGTARFSSDPGPNRLADLRGELTANFAGKPVKVISVGGR